MRYRPYWRTRRRNLHRISRRSSSKSSISRPPAPPVTVLCAFLSLNPNNHIHQCTLFGLGLLSRHCSFGVFLFSFSFSFYYLGLDEIETYHSIDLDTTFSIWIRSLRDLIISVLDLAIYLYHHHHHLDPDISTSI